MMRAASASVTLRLVEPGQRGVLEVELASCKTLASFVLDQPDGWARGEREGYGEPCDVTSLSLSLCTKNFRRVRWSEARLWDSYYPEAL